MTDPSPSPNFLWWGSTIVLEVTAATLLWRLTGNLHWHRGLRFFAVWFAGAGLALALLAAWVSVNNLLQDAGQSLPLVETHALKEPRS